MLTLILGGARSGKSRLAQRLAAKAGSVIYVATAPTDGGDPEMATRIAHHRNHRPSDWETIEEPLALAEAVESATSRADVVLVDCLTLWLSNLFWEYRDSPRTQMEEEWQANLCAITRVSQRSHIMLVSNELGSGTVPEMPVTRDFRDSQGFLNQRAAELADQVILTVAGLPLYLKKSGAEIE